MKKWIYLLMIFGLFILGGCNLFSGLDEEDLDGSSFDYKLEESMASGDYATVVSLVTNKIASTPELKIIDDELKEYEPDWETATTTQLKDYYDELIIYYNTHSSEAVDNYIELKLNEAGANLGLAGLKMTDIVAQITNATKSTTKVVDESAIELGELVPNGLNGVYLDKAIRAYIMGLPMDELRENLELYYLNGSLSSAISAVNRAVQIFAVDPNANEIIFKPWNSSSISDDIDHWNDLVSTTKMELTVAKRLLNLYISSDSETIDLEDADEINGKITALIDTIKEFAEESDYTAFASAAGITVEQ